MDVAKRTEHVYYEICTKKVTSLAARLMRCMSAGPFAGPLLCFIVIMLKLASFVCELIWPLESIDTCPDFEKRLPAAPTGARHSHSSSSSSMMRKNRNRTTNTDAPDE